MCRPGMIPESTVTSPDITEPGNHVPFYTMLSDILATDSGSGNPDDDLEVLPARIWFNDDELIHEDYHLWLRVLVGPNRNTIWRRPRSEYSDEENIAFKIELSSDGKSIPSNQHEKWIGKAQRIDVAEELGFAVYIGEIFMRAYLKNAMNESGGYPFFSCIASTKQKVKAIFALDQKLGKKVECNGYWNLTDQIQVRILHMNSKLGRDFEFYYSKIDQGLKQTIIEEPPEN